MNLPSIMVYLVSVLLLLGAAGLFVSAASDIAYLIRHRKPNAPKPAVASNAPARNAPSVASTTASARVG
jgi:hypothetical protein